MHVWNAEETIIPFVCIIFFLSQFSFSNDIIHKLLNKFKMLLKMIKISIFISSFICSWTLDPKLANAIKQGTWECGNCTLFDGVCNLVVKINKYKCCEMERCQLNIGVR